MRFSCDILQNMLENGHSNLQTNLWVHITSNIFKISNSKIAGSHQPPPDLPTLKAYLTPGVGGRFGIFSLKWRERMNLMVPGAILPLGLRFWAPGRKPLGGLVQPPPPPPPLRRTRVKDELDRNWSHATAEEPILVLIASSSQRKEITVYKKFSIELSLCFTPLWRLHII